MVIPFPCMIRDGGGDDGTTQSRSGTAVLRVPPRRGGSGRSSGAADRGVRGPVVGLWRAGALLLRDRPAFDRPGADDPDAHPRLCLRDPVGAATLSRGSGQLGLSMVLRSGP